MNSLLPPPGVDSFPEIPPPPPPARLVTPEPPLSRVAAAFCASLVSLVGLYVIATTNLLFGLIAACVVGVCCRFLWWLT